MNKIIFITLIFFLTSCFYRVEFHKPKNQKGLHDAHVEGRKYKTNKLIKKDKV
jgi:hypothetical protein